MIYLSKGGAGANSDHTWIRLWSLKEMQEDKQQFAIGKSTVEYFNKQYGVKTMG